MAEEIFGEPARHGRQSEQLASKTAKSASSVDTVKKATGSVPSYVNRRRGNHYAKYTRKFSLGNGPPDWVQEYLISKEGGKMLGTLVALAIARMRNLETFVWDMPTGVLRDVWLALSSLADRGDEYDCRLERVWIRWHNNAQIESTNPAPPPPLPLSNIPPPPDVTHASVAGIPQHNPIAVSAHNSAPAAQVTDRVENPTFSVLPPLKSLTVLDIDELPYLDEMSVLISHSKERLRELRVGIARHAQQRNWVTAWEGEGVQQVDYTTTWTAASSIGDKRLGGVLGILVGRVYNLRQNLASSKVTQSSKDNEQTATGNDQATVNNSEQEPPPQGQSGQGVHPQEDTALALDGTGTPNNAALGSPIHSISAKPKNSVSFHQVSQDAARAALHGSGPRELPGAASAEPSASEHISTGKEDRLDGKLTLETLELERVPLSVSILQRAFDWSILTNLTLLNCQNHEQLWKALRRTYSPRPTIPATNGDGGSGPSDSHSREPSSFWSSQQRLNLKKIHTNTVSSALITFLRETLAANTLEVLFLQESRTYTSSVTVDSIYRGPLRRHRTSLKKLMIDSSEKASDGHSNSRWKRWMLSREILTYITSGRMTNLKELAVTIDYRDWVCV